MSDVIITVRGEHEVRIAPERAVVHLSVQTEGPERGQVVERIAQLTTPVREDLIARQEAGGLVEWSSQRVSVWSDRPWNTEGKQLALVHHASVELTATFADFAALSWWASEVVERDGVQLGWVSWELTPRTRAEKERDVAAEAVRVAVARATAYAAAIGLAEVSPREIADLGLLSRAEQESAQPKMMRAMAMDSVGSAGGGPSIELQPEDITLGAAVEARFAAC